MRNYYYAFWTKYYEWVFHKRKSHAGATVVMFHSVVDGETNPKTFVTNKESFIEFVEKQRDKRGICALETALDGKGDGQLVLTFDDVYETVYTNAYPFLKQNHVPFTLFVSTALIDKPGYITREQLLEMADDELCTVGAHTVNHIRLRTAPDSMEEIAQSKCLLESITGRRIRYFAYPYGSVWACSAKNRREAKRVGFDAAFSTMRGVMPERVKPYRFWLPRKNGDHLVKMMEKGKES